MTSITASYLSAGCNRSPGVADWGRNCLICYGYSRSIAVFKHLGDFTGSGKVITNITGHSETVNCLAWVKYGPNDETELVSGSADETAILWGIKGEELEQLSILKGHEGSVTCVSAVKIPGKADGIQSKSEIVVVTAAIDSTVRIWTISEKNISKVQILKFGNGFALSLATHIISGTNVPVIACGSDDHKIRLYVRQQTEVLALSGHEDWVRGLHFATDDSGDILLASCAQDCTIRLWRLAKKSDKDDFSQVQKSVAELPADEDIAVKETLFSFVMDAQTLTFAVSLESVLLGHENWVYSIKWQPPQLNDDGSFHQPMSLLSASMDKTMILWGPDSETGIWIDQVRVGDVGGNTLGFFGGIFSPCGQSILAHGYQGAFHQWSRNKTTGEWQPQVTCGGHFAPVMDLCWSGVEADFVLSASRDQTTRLHAPWVNGEGQGMWYEIARPQVHGYDLQCLAVLGKYKFASGADEKLVRVFSAPRNFIKNFCQTCGHDEKKEFSQQAKHLPEGANVPALGLSNKAVFSGENEDEKDEEKRPGQYPENYFSPVDLAVPPSEDQLIQNTLWPEEVKLYGHGYEIFSLAAHPSGKLLASACKAAKAEVANILLWDIETNKIVDSLAGCSLTVTQMAFSHCGSYLLAVSRDRSWALFKLKDDGHYAPVVKIDKKTSPHSRIIWSCAWSHDDKYFFTSSRDKKVMAWNVASVLSDTASAPQPSACLTLSNSVTAVSIAPALIKERYLLATGLDDGQVALHIFSPGDKDDGDCSQWKQVATMGQQFPKICPDSPSTTNGIWNRIVGDNLDEALKDQAHHLTVTRLAFRPQQGRVGHAQDEDTSWLQLASCGSDHAVRIYDIDYSGL